ncbi:RNA 3'-terminal phosphate cyclase [Insolitispirillum peregrinum]|uniref:RNA 3'-terminal phosphate cyclase n=1 Tax=Insolitispirillum peregrinum TaxID=80876 RepID=UPI003609ACF7
MSMILIDGSEGEGGGQILRNAAALSLITGSPFSISNIRGKRPKPGLMRQHLTALEAACAISGSQCDGLSVGSSGITFRPGRAVGGEYRFAVGTAGSTALVLQTILFPLVLADTPSRVILEGGTHAIQAPPFDFIERVFLPLVNRMGPQVSARLVRHGFYPRGGGRIEIDITPAPLRPLDCLDRGELLAVSGQAVFSGLAPEIARRMMAQAQKDLPDWPETAFAVRQLPEDQGPGVALMLEARHAHGTEMVSAFGQMGVSAEKLGKTAAVRMIGYLNSTAFAGPYLADQLILPFALAGKGRFTTVKPSQHTLSAIDIVQRFTGKAMTVTQGDDGVYLVEIQ